MTVEELIDELSKLPADQRVRIYEDSLGCDTSVMSVEVILPHSGADYVALRA